MRYLWVKMRARWRPIVLTTVAAYMIAAVVSSPLGSQTPWLDLVDILLFPGPFILVGCVILLRADWHRVGWLLLGAGVAVTLPVFDVPVLPSWYAAWTGSQLEGPNWPPSWPYIANFAFLAYTTMVFPSGRLATQTRIGASAAKAVQVALPLLVLAGAFVRDPGFVDGVAVPFGFLPSWVLTVSGFATVLLLWGGTASLVVRFLRSTGEVRAQLAWVVSSLILVAVMVAIVVACLFLTDLSAIALAVPVVVAFLSLPLAFMIAILRYRLYDIDRIISRTLTYGLLTAGLGATYFALVVALQALLRPFSDGSDLAIVATTLVVAALFLPARHRVQRIVDRRFNRRSYDAARTVEAFSARLREQTDLDTLRDELLSVVVETMQPARTSLWLREPEVRR